jgi:hypothetical protein
MTHWSSVYWHSSRVWAAHEYITSNISAASCFSRGPKSSMRALGARSLGSGYFRTCSTVKGDSHSSSLPADHEHRKHIPNVKIRFSMPLTDFQQNRVHVRSARRQIMSVHLRQALPPQTARTSLFTVAGGSFEQARSTN